MPLNARRRQPECTAEPLVVEVSVFIVHECSGDVLVQAIAPRRGIGCGAAEGAHRHGLRKPPSNVTTINRAQAGRPWKIKSPKSHPNRPRIWFSIGAAFGDTVVARTSSSNGSPYEKVTTTG